MVGAEEHGNFRPITICSLWFRLLNKLLVEKLESANTILDCQTQNGVAEAINQLTRIFSKLKKNTKPFAIALVGFSKAFDSVRHKAKVSTFELRSVPTWLIDSMTYRHQGHLRWKLYNLRWRTNTSKKKDTTKGLFKSTSLQPCTR